MGTARRRFAPFLWVRSWPGIRPYLPWLVAAAFSVSGVIHVVRPHTFAGIVPHFLPGPTALVEVSGVVELLCAYGLWRRRRWAGLASALLLLVIWPANLQDAISAQQGHDTVAAVLAWIRFPLQVPLIWCAWQSGGGRAHRRRTPWRRTTPAMPIADPIERPSQSPLA